MSYSFVIECTMYVFIYFHIRYENTIQVFRYLLSYFIIQISILFELICIFIKYNR